MYRYRGGYSACERQRAERFDRDQRVAEQTQRESDHLKKFIDRFQAQANKARQVQSRIKAMEKLVVAAPTEARRRLRLSFDPVGQMPDPVILARDLSAGYGETTILSHVDLKIERGARVGLLGRNGRGKSTLIKTLIGELPLLGGQLQRWPSGRVAYFAQDAVDHLQPDQSALEHLRSLTARHLGVASPDGQLRQWLGRFAFQDEDAMRPVGPMSGGERARLVLALCLWIRPQILVLDEPTNHLDADTRDALTESLLAFDGVLLLVSHDRYLLNACVDRFVLVNDGGVREFDGDLADYARLLANGDAPQQPVATAAARSGGIEETAAQRKQQRREQADRRIRLANALKPLKLEQERLDRAMADLESKIGALDTRIADPALYDDPGAASALIQDRGRLAARLATTEAEWFANAEAQEQLVRSHEMLTLGG
ncbi:MAG: ATP-binding cassette domain-containing protein [Burkholderiaceae bacterium]